MKIDNLEFRPIDLDLHKATCIKIREDSFVCSFGAAEKFHHEFGSDGERYVGFLMNRMQSLPNSCVHAWLENEIVGQVEVRRSRKRLDEGYVNLYYLTEKHRGSGLGTILDEYVEFYFRELRIKSAQLSVAPTNLRALKFYSKCGWKDLGPRPNHPDVNLMEKVYG